MASINRDVVSVSIPDPSRPHIQRYCLRFVMPESIVLDSVTARTQLEASLRERMEDMLRSQGIPFWAYTIESYRVRVSPADRMVIMECEAIVDKSKVDDAQVVHGDAAGNPKDKEVIVLEVRREMNVMSEPLVIKRRKLEPNL